jgi:hypothetical protein
LSLRVNSANFSLLSTSLFTELLSQEKLKSNQSFSSHTLGNNVLDFKSCLFSSSNSFDNLEIIGHHGYQRFIIFATLSKASHQASSVVHQSLL